MSDKLIEATILKLRSNILAAVAAIEAIIGDPRSIDRDSTALEEIEKHAVAIGQSELAIKAIEKIKKISHPPRVIEPPSTQVEHSHVRSMTAEQISEKNIKIRAEPPRSKLASLVKEAPALVLEAEDKGAALYDDLATAPDSVEDYKKLLAARIHADKTPHRRRHTESPNKKNKK
jgi:hypothetical protein